MMSREQLEHEALAQKKLWDHLRKWLLYAAVASSVLVAGICWTFMTSWSYAAAVRTAAIILLVLDCIWMLLIVRSLRHGRENIEKLLRMAEQK